MGVIKIEKNVPIPDGRTTRKFYPIKGMEVGDSFFIEGGKQTAVINSLRNYKQTLGYEFTSRSIDGGVRVWRTK